MGALIKKSEARSGRHSFEASGPSLPFRTVNQAAESPVAAATIKQVGRNVSSWRGCDKAALSSGCKSHPATAPAGSNRSSYGGNEVAVRGVAGESTPLAS